MEHNELRRITEYGVQLQVHNGLSRLRKREERKREGRKAAVGKGARASGKLGRVAGCGRKDGEGAGPGRVG